VPDSSSGKPAPLRDYQALIYGKDVSGRGAGAESGPLTAEQEESRFDFFRVKFSPWLTPDRKAALLDLGCGQGHFLKYLDRQGYANLTGVDISPEQCRLAKAAVPSAALLEMNLFEFLADKTNGFDCISALDVIEHLEKTSVVGFLRAVHRALKPGGRLILQTPNAASPWGMAVRYGDFTHECCFTPNSLTQLLTLVGFTGIALQPSGPIPRSLKGLIRVWLWKFFSLYYRLYNLVETGSGGGGLYSRVFLCLARKPPAD